MSTFNSVICPVARTREPVTSNLAAEMISLFGGSNSHDDDGKKKAWRKKGRGRSVRDSKRFIGWKEHFILTSSVFFGGNWRAGGTNNSILSVLPSSRSTRGKIYGNEITKQEEEKEEQKRCMVETTGPTGARWNFVSSWNRHWISFCSNYVRRVTAVIKWPIDPP